MISVEWGNISDRPEDADECASCGSKVTAHQAAIEIKNEKLHEYQPPGIFFLCSNCVEDLKKRLS